MYSRTFSVWWRKGLWIQWRWRNLWWVLGIKIPSTSTLFLYTHLLRTNFFICFRVYLAALHKREKFCSYKGRRRSLRKYSTRTGNKSFIIYVKTAKWIIKIPISDFSKEILPYNMFFFSVCTILRTIHPIYLSLFPLFDREEGVLFILTEQREGDEQGKLLFCLWLLWTEVSDKYVIRI